MKNPFAKKPKNDYGAFDDSYEDDLYGNDEENADGILDDYEEEKPVAALPPKKNTAGAAGANKVKVVKPRDYQDGPSIADELVDGYTVVMDIEALERESARRLIDFLLGAIHVLGGELRRVTKTTLVISPRSGEVVGEDEDNEEDEGV